MPKNWPADQPSFSLVMNNQASRAIKGYGPVVVLGRDKQCSIQLDDPLISRTHTRIFYSNGHWFIEDNHSANGTWLNRQRITQALPLKAGDLITLGSLTYAFQPDPVARYTSQPVKSKRRRWTPVACLFLSALLAVVVGGALLAVVIYFRPLIPFPWSKDIGLDPKTGGTITAKDGASVTFPPHFSDRSLKATLTKTADNSTETVDGTLSASGVYVLKLSEPGALQSGFIIALPVNVSLFPTDWKPAGLVPEVFDEQAGSWKPVGTLVVFDKQTNMVSFNVDVGDIGSRSLKKVEPALVKEDLQKLSSQAQQTTTSKFRIQLHTFSSWRTVSSEDSDFTIQYYPLPGEKYSLKSDNEWNSATGKALDPNVPDYIEDLDVALNEAYNKLLQVQQQTGPLFTPLSTPIEVIVTDTGNVEGNTSLTWGTFKISSNRIDNWGEMRHIAAHELIHLFQDQYYNAFTASTNLWYFEASADFLAAMVNGMDEAGRGTFYAREADEFLSVTLSSNSANSMYAAAHFLDWLNRTYSPTLVQDAIQLGGLSSVNRDDLANLTGALRVYGEADGLSKAWLDYTHYLLTSPEGNGGSNATLVSNARVYTQAYLSAKYFDDTTTFIQLKREIPPLAIAVVSLRAQNSDNAMLVVAPVKVEGGDVRSFTYDIISGKDADYQQSAPLDQDWLFPYLKDDKYGSLSLMEFGKLETHKVVDQMLVNINPKDASTVEVAYYILRPVVVLGVSDGNVKWSIAKLGNLPREWIKGFWILKDGLRINQDPAPLPQSGFEASYNNSNIRAGDNIVVSVVDKFGNYWPQATVSAPTGLTVTGELRNYIIIATNSDGITNITCPVPEGQGCVGDLYLDGNGLTIDDYEEYTRQGSEESNHYTSGFSQTTSHTAMPKNYQECPEAIIHTHVATYNWVLDYDPIKDAISLSFTLQDINQSDSREYYTVKQTITDLPRKPGDPYSGPFGTYALVGEAIKDHFDYSHYGASIEIKDNLELDPIGIIIGCTYTDKVVTWEEHIGGFFPISNLEVSIYTRP